MTLGNPFYLRVGAALLLIVVLGMWRHAHRRRALAESLGGRSAAGRLSAANLYRWRVERGILVGVAAMALAAAAAGPAWNVAPPEPPPEPAIRNVIVAIDVSASMQASDVEPNRLAGATAAAADIISALENDRVGLLLFAGTPYPLAPPTSDHEAVRYLLGGVTPTIASAHDPGSLPSVAIGEAMAMLERWAAERDERAIVLISDGEAGEPASASEEAARAAAEAGVQVHTIGVGTAAGAGMVMPEAPYQLGGRIVGENGGPAVSRLREENLTRAATAGGGSYAALDDASAMNRLLEAIAAPSVLAAPTPEPDAPVWLRLDPVVWLTSASLLLLFVESLLDVRLPGGARALVRRTA
jgi:Ca-activated chloride channel homolog